MPTSSYKLPAFSRRSSLGPDFNPGSESADEYEPASAGLLCHLRTPPLTIPLAHTIPRLKNLNRAMTFFMETVEKFAYKTRPVEEALADLDEDFRNQVEALE